MKNKFGLLLLPFLLSSLFGKPTPNATPAVLVFTHVTVIDMTGAPSHPNMSVLITGNRITALGDSEAIHAPKDARVIDATGKFLIPGLWDMHVHPPDKPYLPLFIANGVTGIRIMWGDPQHYEWRKEIQAGELLGPRMLIASPIVDGPKPFWPGSIAVSTEAEARQAVDRAKELGADFVKVYTFLPREEYFAIAGEAKKQGISFEGHVPMAVSAQEASNAGQKSFEHLTGILPACSLKSEELNRAGEADLAEYIATDNHQFEGPRLHALRSEMLDTYNPEKAAALFGLLKRNGTWQCPTLTLWRMFSSLNDSSFTGDPRLRFVPVRTRESWDPAIVSKASVSENTALGKRGFEIDLRVVGAMQKAGVGILAGTDTGNPYCMPGFSLHDELGLLVRAGLTPMEALQAATLNPARFLGREGDLGTVEKGKIADLILLDANPLDDIANTNKIAAVVYDGQFLPRAKLDAMLSNVEALAGRKPIGEVLLQTIQEKNIAAAVQQFHELKSSQPSAYDFSESELVGLGYHLLHEKKIPDAIEVFKLSVEAYPQSYNTYDSLAEAYMDHGDKDLAIQNYQKSLQLNPRNENGVRMLKKLAAQ
jgi:hypothetical protein